MNRLARCSLNTDTSCPRGFDHVRALASPASWSALVAFVLSACDGAPPTAPADGPALDRALVVAMAAPADEPARRGVPAKIRGTVVIEQMRGTDLGTSGAEVAVESLEFVMTTKAGLRLSLEGDVRSYRFHPDRELHEFALQFSGITDPGSVFVQGQGRILVGPPDEMVGGDLVWHRMEDVPVDIEFSNWGQPVLPPER